MQLVPRYLVSNRATIIADVAGFVTEYRPVYSRHLQIYRGIDNVVEFKVLNADQKPVDLSGYTPKFQAFDENNRLVITHDGVQVTTDGSTPIKGLCKVTITESDTLDLKDQYLKYSVHLTDVNNESTLTYSDSHFSQTGVIQLSSNAFPGPKNSIDITTWNEYDWDVGTYYSSVITAEPGINGNEALHTAVFYTDGFSGTVEVQTTLDNTEPAPDSAMWNTFASLTFNGAETEPRYVNFNGVFSYIRFSTSTDPRTSITKILVRN